MKSAFLTDKRHLFKMQELSLQHASAIFLTDKNYLFNMQELSLQQINLIISSIYR
ncbi:hypothetical protein HMPREF9145_1325 [Segatella salivae F0493]|uniref:Uncharacterized protein n=1 Tax=Segatella salivae F0493 TaxID=1395125 RepID=U2MF71_9BACT|nr:hypothetical protein HMPREF9145_1325 [Segatella salivae F0493]